MHPVKLKYTVKLSLGLAFLIGAILLLYWLFFVYGVRNWLAIGAILIFLILPTLKSLIGLPNEFRALMLVWQTDDPETAEKLLGDLRSRGGGTI